jgi:hypothetical protein
MMSAAILLTAVGERGNVHSVSADQGGREGESFARSLSERIDDAISGQAKSPSVASPLILPGSKSERPATKPDEVMDARTGLKAGLKEETAAAPGSSANSRPKTPVVGNIVASELRPTSAQSAKLQESRPAMDVVDSPELRTGDVDHSTIDAASSQVASVTESARNGLVRARVAENALAPVLSAGDEGVGCQVVEASGEPKKISSLQGSVRTQAKQTGRKNSSKTLEPGRSSHSAGQAIAAPDTCVDISAASVQTVAYAAALQDKSGNTANWDADAKPVVGGSSVRALSSSTATVGHMQVESAKGDDVDTRAMASALEDDLGASPKGLETSAASSTAPLNDVDRKPQAGTELVANVVHSVTTIGTVAVANGGILPGGQVGDVSAAKSTIASTSVHEAASSAISREQDVHPMLAMPSDGIPQTLTATPNALEVGIQDGTHGWLRVRAEMTNGGSVNASVSVTSPAAQEMLHRELPSLTAYLQEEKVAVNTVVVHAPVSSAVVQRSFAGEDAAGGQAAQSGNEGEERRQYTNKAISGGSGAAGARGSLLGFEEDGSLQHGTYSGGGSWLSVRA